MLAPTQQARFQVDCRITYRLPTGMSDEMTWRMGNDKTLKLVLKNFNWNSQVSKSYWFGKRTAWKLYELNWDFNAYKIYDAKHRTFVPSSNQL